MVIYYPSKVKFFCTSKHGKSTNSASPIPKDQFAWTPDVPYKWQDVFWMAKHGGLWTGEKAQKLNFKAISPFCYRCGKPEGIHHVFIGCEPAKEIWCLVRRILKDSIHCHSLSAAKILRGFTMKHYRDNLLWMTCHRVAFTTIWKYRTMNVYHPNSLTPITHIFLSHLISTLSSNHLLLLLHPSYHSHPTHQTQH